ncbi:MAG: DUF342 domain-containing protein [Candidatus Omnitrophota bacterium]|jgi:uncharacterized protein (DUF342 family)|nr:MAG: DUF342 domain-containing protein [Candidatus Omnitrophota bacterium]
MNTNKDTSPTYSQTIDLIKEGLNTTIQAIRDQSDAVSIADDLCQSLPLIDQLQGWSSSLPPDRFRATLLSLINTLDQILLKAVKAGRVSPVMYGATEEFPTAPFIMEAVTQVGPELTVSKDHMRVTLALPEEFKHVWTPERMKAGLERQGIVFGINEEKLLLLKKKKPGTSVPVAFGQEPVSGNDAVLEECLGLCELSGKPSRKKGNRVDYKQLNSFLNVVKGQVVIKKTPATQGTAGMDVFGSPIPCRDGVDFPFPPIQNTSISPDGLAIVASVDGCAYIDAGAIVIVPALEIKTNVDYSTGNVDASVAVTVNGDVLSGFKVESLEDVVVKGTVEAGHLVAGKNIFLPGGVQGKESARIIAGKHIDAKFFNAATIQAGRTVSVHGFVMQCRVKAKRLRLDGKEGELIGGVVDAVDDVCAIRIGSEMGVKTQIRLGFDLTELQQSIEKLDEELTSLKEKIKRYSDSLATLNKWKEKKGFLPPDKQEMQDKLTKNLNKANEILAQKEERLDKTRQEMESSTHCARMVRASETIMPGVEITILNHNLTIKKPTGPATVYLVNDALEIYPYQDRNFEGEEDVE